MPPAVLNFCQRTAKSGFWVDGWVLAVGSNHFWDFLEIFLFPKSLKPLGNSYIHFLVIIIYFHFTCGEEKLC